MLGILLPHMWLSREKFSVRTIGLGLQEINL